MQLAREQELQEPSGRLGRYRILTQLGQGGMGAIHLAVASGLGEFEKLVVLKELRPEFSQNSEFVNMFLREVKLAGRLNHANIVHTFEAGEVDGRYFMSMEFLDGQTFTKVLSRSGERLRVPLRLRLQIICDVLAGLHYAHELKDYDGTPLSVVHCDVSFANVFITYEGEVKLVDFGVARVAESLCKNQGFQGKVRYAAPEQLTGEPIDRRADIFSAGILLWEALALRRYAVGTSSDRSVVEARLKGTEPKIGAVLPHIDQELAAISNRALERNPADRFATAHDFRVALGSYLDKLGPRIDATEIGRFMTTEFASERAQVHTLISAKLRDPSETSVSQTLQRVPGHDDVTTVADISSLVDSLDPLVGGVGGAIKNPKPRSGRPAIALGALALLALGSWGIRAIHAPGAANVSPHDAHIVQATMPLSPLASGGGTQFDAPAQLPPSRNQALKASTKSTSASGKPVDGGAAKQGVTGAVFPSSPTTATGANGTSASDNAAPASPGSDLSNSGRIPSRALGQEMTRKKPALSGIDVDNPFK